MIYALINASNIVENTIVCEPENIGIFTPDWEYVVEIDNIPGSPGIGWTYDSGTETFTPPE